jgi:hypothetical protein
MTRRTTKLDKERRQLAALATLLGLMQTAGRLSNELDHLAGDIGGSLDKIVETAGIPYLDVYNVHRVGARRARTAKKPRKKGG